MEIRRLEFVSSLSFILASFFKVLEIDIKAKIGQLAFDERQTVGPSFALVQTLVQIVVAALVDGLELAGDLSLQVRIDLRHVPELEFFQTQLVVLVQVDLRSESFPAGVHERVVEI